ncbi:restriction endonuclease subunit S [Campylobacter lari]
MQNKMTNLPQGWEVKKLEEIANIKGGKRLPKGENLLDNNTKFAYIRVADFQDNGTINLQNIKFINENTYNVLKNYKIYDDNLYISIAGTIGKSGIIPKELNGAILTENAVKLEYIQNNISNKFMYFFTLSNIFKTQIQTSTKIVAQPKLAITRLKQIQIPLPPLKEQERIVGILDESFAKIDESIKILEQDLLNLDELMQSALQKAFNPLKDNTKENYKLPQGWEKFNFDNIFYSPSSKNYQLNTKDYLEKGCIPIIDQSKKFIIGYSNNYEKVFKINNCNNSCIIFGDHTRVLKFIDFDFIVGADGVKILLNKDIERFNTKFLFFQLLYKDIPLLGYRRHFSVLKQNTFSIPPLKEQEQIASHLDELSSHVKNLKQNYQMQIKNLQELKKSLLDKAFQGRL